jgi:uncharacterized protein YjbJ (UPF0337 family)
MTGDNKMRAEGKLDKAKGEAHNLAGDLKDSAKHAEARKSTKSNRPRLGWPPRSRLLFY